MVSSTINTHAFPGIISSALARSKAHTYTMAGTKLVALGFIVLLSVGLANSARVARYSSAGGTGTGEGGGGA
jgi:hypothetical protein